MFAVVTGVDPAAGLDVADPSAAGADPSVTGVEPAVAGVEPTVSGESVDADEASSFVVELS